MNNLSVRFFEPINHRKYFLNLCSLFHATVGKLMKSVQGLFEQILHSFEADSIGKYFLNLKSKEQRTTFQFIMHSVRILSHYKWFFFSSKNLNIYFSYTFASQQMTTNILTKNELNWPVEERATLRRYISSCVFKP